MPARPRHLLPYLGAVSAALAVHLWLWDASWGTFTRSMDFNRGALEDFMGPYLGTARAVLETREPAAGFLYPPTFALLLVPLGWLGPGAASWVWLALELGASAALVALALALVRERPRWMGPLYVFAALLAFPLAHNLHWGQVSVPIGALVLAGLTVELRGRARAAALCLALAASIKLYPALFLVVPLAREDWRAVGWTAAALALLLAGLPAAVLGPTATLDFYRDVLAELARLEGAGGAWHDATNKQFLPAVLARWCGLEGSGWRLALAALGGLWAGANLFAVRALAGRGTREGRVLATALVALSLPFVVSPSWPHYLALLPFAQLAVAAAGRRDPLVLALVGGSAVLASAPVMRALGWQAYGASGLLLAADLTALLALYRVLATGRGGGGTVAQSSSPA